MDKKNLLDQVKYPVDLRKFNKEELKQFSLISLKTHAKTLKKKQ